MDEQQLQQIAAQLRKPHGDDGIKTAEMMNKGNLHIHLDTLSLLDASAGDKLLEIGMGNGFYVKDVLSRHPSITYAGCDYSALMVEQALEMNAEWILQGRAKFIHADITSLPFPDQMFNKIFTINTVYFWENESAALSEIRRVLLPCGKFIISFRPKDHTEKYPFIKYGFRQYSKEEITEMLSSNGFTINMVYENPEPDFDMNGEIMKMKNVVVVAS